VAKVRVHNISISLDGYAAAPKQSLESRFGKVGGESPALHDWMFATRMGRRMLGEDGGTEGLDNDFAMQHDIGIGATIMGRYKSAR
jgi:hypothetical protein